MTGVIRKAGFLKRKNTHLKKWLYKHLLSAALLLSASLSYAVEQGIIEWEYITKEKGIERVYYTVLKEHPNDNNICYYAYVKKSNDQTQSESIELYQISKPEFQYALYDQNTDVETVIRTLLQLDAGHLFGSFIPRKARQLNRGQHKEALKALPVSLFPLEARPPTTTKIEDMEIELTFPNGKTSYYVCLLFVNGTWKVHSLKRQGPKGDKKDFILRRTTMNPAIDFKEAMNNTFKLSEQPSEAKQ